LMVARRLAQHSAVCRAILLAAIVAPGLACMSPGSGRSLVAWKRAADEQPIKLPEAEQLIDELDGILTEYGTISVKTPDVWGQDRLAKFRSEYEAQMSAWLKQGFKNEINASVRRVESEATRVQIGTEVSPTSPKGLTAQTSTISLSNVEQAHAGMDTSLPAPPTSADKSQAMLEQTVVLDEHSNYLNHLNQLRRVNAGDDLADRPGYGLYLIRIPVTLSPGPRSRRGKGAIITVSAKSVMTKHTLRGTLRNAVVNETVNNLTQAICNQWTEDGKRTTGPGSGPYALVGFADTELFYGRRNIELLSDEADRQLSGELGDEPHHRSARVSEWVRNELESAYHLLEDAATPTTRSAQLTTSADPLEELGDRLARRDFTRIAQMLPSPTSDTMVRKTGGQNVAAADELGGRRSHVVNIFAFALKIQAAGVNRRLKDDMVDQVPTLDAHAVKGYSLFEPEVSNQALHAFEQYVEAKWPLRVYAIEPVIAQQNVADVMGRRTQSALDLVGAGLIGPARAITGFASDRRAEADETAVRLNPTMVGFGAGQSTFGWIFYPRLQTGDGRSGRLLTDVALLFSGRATEIVGGDQSIEPGQRECTVLIEMPNFIPKIEFITVADWFRTSEVGGEGQKSDLEKSSILGRMLITAQNAINQAKIEGQYRPEEYQIAMDRIQQLKDMMPTQRLSVRVPFSGVHNDSRIFCSQGLQLRPSLLGWHGKPPMRGEESTIFLEGRNFSVHDTHVIAGGKLASAVLISRNLLEVTIAKAATPTPNDRGVELLDVNVGTPSGVSNHLLIPMCPVDPNCKPDPGPKFHNPLESTMPAGEKVSRHENAARADVDIEDIDGRLSSVQP
jgi:hypothetical protein